MIITYHGHSCFTLRGKIGSAATDPYEDAIGLKLPSLSADVVTISHQHGDHNQAERVTGTARRPKPFVIDHLGEYEVGGVSVFGVPSFHDETKGEERGTNYIFTIAIDGVRVCHLGDLGHELSDATIEAIGDVDVLLVPVGGVYTLGPKQAAAVVRAIEPSCVIPMHYKTAAHDAKRFGELSGVEDFLKEIGAEGITPVDKYKIEPDRLPEEMEVIVLQKT